jgi:hypothetical protein
MSARTLIPDRGRRLDRRGKMAVAISRETIMTTETARRARSTRERAANAAPKSTAYGRAMLRAIDRMKAAGPWQLGPKMSARCFKR